MAKFSAVYKVGKIEVDPKSDQLRCGDQLIEIQSMVMKVLGYFCHHSDRLITRDDLRQEVWQNTATSNHTINNHIYSLRRHIAKLDPSVKYIHTVTGGGANGYRLSEPMIYCDQMSDDGDVNQNTVDIAADSSAANTDNVDATTKHTADNSATQVDSKQGQRHWFKLGLALIGLGALLAAIGLYLSSDPIRYDNVSLLSAQPGREQSPSISADGQIVVYASKHTQDDVWELYASKLDSSFSGVKVFAGNDNYDNFASLSPSGNKLAFHRLRFGEEGIYVADFDRDTLTATNARKLVSLTRDNLSPAISWLDEQRFFYNAQEASWAPKKIYLYDINTAKSEQISSPAIQSNGDFANVVSPNKRWLAIMRASEGYDGVELVLYDIDAKSFINTEVKLTHTRLNVSFSDDSELVYFIDDAGYLAQFDLAQAQVTRISRAVVNGYWPLKVPGKSQFILQQDWGLSSLTTEIVRYANPLLGETSRPQVVVNNGLSIRAITGVADNGFIFVSVKPNHQIELWRYQAGKAYKLEEFQQQASYRYPLSLSWLAGTDQALLSVNGTCRVIDINTGKDTPLCPKGELVYAGTYSADAQSIYFAAFDDKYSKAVNMGMSGYPLVDVPQMERANMVQDSGNGLLYYRVEPGTDIYQYDASTHQTQKLISRHYIANGYTTNDFVVTQSGIYFMDRPKGGRNAVYYYDLATQVTTHLFDTPNLYPNIVLSDDQRHIYLIQSAHNDTGLLLVK